MASHRIDTRVPGRSVVWHSTTVTHAGRSERNFTPRLPTSHLMVPDLCMNYISSLYYRTANGSRCNMVLHFLHGTRDMEELSLAIGLHIGR